jgi:hypothetical protein
MFVLLNLLPVWFINLVHESIYMKEMQEGTSTCSATHATLRKKKQFSVPVNEYHVF